MYLVPMKDFMTTESASILLFPATTLPVPTCDDLSAYRPFCQFCTTGTQHTPEKIGITPDLYHMKNEGHLGWEDTAWSLGQWQEEKSHY